jgi:hypothetical protein
LSHETDIRFHLKLAIIDLESAREQHQVGHAVKTPLLAMRLLDQRLQHTTEDVTELMQELGSEQAKLDTCSVH